MNPANILSFYRDLELLEIPSAGFPRDDKWRWTREVNQEAEALPILPCEDLTGADIPYYKVFVGCPKQADLVQTVARTICGRNGLESFVEERIGGNRGALATLTLDWAGRVIKKSVRVAPFVFACERLANGKDLSGVQSDITAFEKHAEDRLGENYDLRHRDLTAWKMRHEGLVEAEKIAIDAGDVKEFARLEELRARLEVQDISSSDMPASLEMLRAMSAKLAGMIDMSGRLPILVSAAGRKWQEGRLFPYPPGAENFTSYYFDELDRILKGVQNGCDPRTALGAFLEHGQGLPDRVEVMSNDEELSARLNEDQFAPARWPAAPEHALSMAQQIGVQDALDTESPITAINGPPGTGKTTLLRDVIANMVTQRALRLAGLKKPADAFKVSKGVATALPGIVEGTEIVVASNGNRAVENITLEIPRASEIDTKTFPGASYLAEAAEAVALAFEKPSEAWGMIALTMGKKSNITKTMSALKTGARSQDGRVSKVGLIATLEASGKPKRGEWKQAVTDFEKDIDAFREIMRRRAAGEDASQFCSLNDALGRHDDRHSLSVWTDPDLDELRSRIFIRALRLHEIVLRSKPDALSQFIEEFNAVLTGEKEATPSYQMKLWRTFFMISPVISTTFASMRRLPLQAGWIGCLMIDEAGQATPQSAVPGLYRAKKAVIVGDPAQLQPIFTVPKSVIEALRQRRDVPEALSPTQESAQSIADACMRIGGYLPDPVNPATLRWAGIPLRVHRRCAQPMFDVINKVSYDGQMVPAGNLRAAAQSLQNPYRHSQWFDVRSSGGSGHIVKAEMDCLEDVLTRFRDAGVLGQNGNASAMVVTPFARVQSSSRKVIKKVFGKSFTDIEAGTIHRFQGREADIVFLVLGSAAGRYGDRSREWASAHPNLINVAVSRARKKIFVIGNHVEWSRMPYFNTLSAAFRGTLAGGRTFNLVQPYNAPPPCSGGDLIDMARAKD